MVPQTQGRNGQPPSLQSRALLLLFSLVFGSHDWPWVRLPTPIRFMPSPTPEHPPRNNLKIATNYIENYTFVFHDTMIWRKYAILSALMQTPNSQRITLLTTHFTLHFSTSRLAIHAFSQCDSLPFEPRNMPTGNSISHLSQLDTCLTATAWLFFAAPIPQKRRFRALFHAKSRHNFLAIKSNKRSQTINSLTGKDKKLRSTKIKKQKRRHACRPIQRER